MPMLAPIAMGVGTAVSAIGAISSANAQAGAANYNAQVAAQKAQVEDWNRQRQQEQFSREAILSNQQYAQQDSSLELHNGAVEAHNIASAASSGLAISGSTKDVILSSAYNNELEVAQNQFKGQLKAYEIGTQADTAGYNSVISQNNDIDQMHLDQAQASNAKTSGLFNAAGAVLGGIGGIAGSSSRLDYMSGGGGGMFS